MYNYPRLIWGFKKKVQVQFTFDHLPKRRVVQIAFFALAIILVALFVWIFVKKPSQQETLTQKSVEQAPKPAQATPKTNPFEVKTNPFKDIKTNPFR